MGSYAKNLNQLKTDVKIIKKYGRVSRGIEKKQ